jgi:hypothetical protein
MRVREYRCDQMQRANGNVESQGDWRKGVMIMAKRKDS